MNGSSSQDMIEKVAVAIYGSVDCLTMFQAKHAAAKALEAAGIERLNRELREATSREARWERWPFGDAGDAVDFACDHCGPHEALAFLEDWRGDMANEWPGYIKWLKLQRDNAALSRMEEGL